MTKPLSPGLTIVCVSYKRYKEIHTLINSFLCQSYEGWRLDIIHDGPDAVMEELVNAYAAKDPRIHFEATKERHNDWGHTLREMGLRDCGTEWILFTNDDNYYAPRFLQYMFEAIQKDNLDLVLCNMVHSHPNPGKYKQDDYHLFDSFPRKNYVDIGNFIIRTAIAQRVGFADHSYAADGEFIDRVMAQHNVECFFGPWHRRWKYRTWRKDPDKADLRVGKEARVLYVHN
jgi:hypothetical protein